MNGVSKRVGLKTSLLLVMLIIGKATFAQSFQTLRGIVIDRESQSPLEKAIVQVRWEQNSDSLRQSKSNSDGSFVIKNAWVGRNEVLIRLDGYSPFVANGFILSSGKEGVLYVSLDKEFVERMGSVDLKARKSNDQTNNDAALISARLFTVEETDRFAGQ